MLVGMASISGLREKCSSYGSVLHPDSSPTSAVRPGAFDRAPSALDNAAVSRLPLQRLVTVALACCWLLPGLLALAVVLHVELDHHGHGTSDDRAAELALAVGHGHSHELADAGHEHPASREGRRQSAQAPAEAADLPWGSLQAWSSDGAQADATAPRRPPPRPLFTLHCALLS